MSAQEHSSRVEADPLTLERRNLNLLLAYYGDETIESSDSPLIKGELEPYLPSANPVEDLKYFNLYPKKVRKWVLGSLSAKGMYDPSGNWVNWEEIEVEYDKELSESDKEFERGYMLDMVCTTKTITICNVNLGAKGWVPAGNKKNHS
jgi:hypothetical protein